MEGYFSKLSWVGTGSLLKFKTSLTNLWDQHKNKCQGPTNAYFEVTMQIQQCKTLHTKHVLHKIWNTTSLFRTPQTRLWAAQLWVWIPAEARDFSPLKNVQTGSGSHSLSYSMNTEGSFPGVKLSGHKADHSPTQCQGLKWVKLYLHSPYMPSCWVQGKTWPFTTILGTNEILNQSGC